MIIFKILFAVLICIPFGYFLVVLLSKSMNNIIAQYKKADRDER